jgi:hypothetical protein
VPAPGSATRGPASIRAIFAIVTAATALLVAGPSASPVAAECAGVQAIADALLSGNTTVFVGNVVKLDNDNRWATVLVDERWHNADGVPDTAFIHGGPEAGKSGIDQRIFALGRYVFAVTNEGPYYVDSACTATTPWSDDLVQYRPTNVAEGSGSGSGSPLDFLESGSAALAAGLALALLIAVVAYILILRRRKRPPDWMR